MEGDGDLITKTLSVDSFHSVNINNSIDISFSQGPLQEVKATGQENIIDELLLEISNGEWDIDFENDCYKDYQLSLSIVLPNLKKIAIDGSSDVVVNDFLNQESLNISINGSGDVVLNKFNGTSLLGIEIDGSGNVTARSDFEDIHDLTIDIDGSGNCSLYNINTPNCDISIDGSGDCKVRVEDFLNVSIDGSGDVSYKGNPSISESINGSGNLIDDN